MIIHLLLKTQLVFSFFLKRVFKVDHFRSLYWICYTIASVVYVLFFFCLQSHMGSYLLDPWPGKEPSTPSPQLEGGILTTGQSVQSHVQFMRQVFSGVSGLCSQLWDQQAGSRYEALQPPMLRLMTTTLCLTGNCFSNLAAAFLRFNPLVYVPVLFINNNDHYS